MFFSAIWAVVKRWLDPVTAKKIHQISGSGKKELLKIIEARNLPRFLGGEATDDLKTNPGVWSEEY